MRIVVTGARGKPGVVTVARLQRTEDAASGPSPALWSYVVVEDVAELFAPAEQRTEVPRRLHVPV
jgi:hypothetical protein